MSLSDNEVATFLPDRDSDQAVVAAGVSRLRTGIRAHRQVTRSQLTGTAYEEPRPKQTTTG